MAKVKIKEVEGVYVLIRRLQSIALEKQDDAELGKFHRQLAIELGKNEPKGDTEASIFAKELLENARDYLQTYRTRAKKAANARWGRNTPQEPQPEDFIDGNPF